MSDVIAPRVIAALDFNSTADADHFIARINPTLCRLKIGSAMFTQLGPDYVRQLIEKKFSVFLDLKFHDIPNTVSEACTASAKLGVWMINVHALGGREMMLAARAAVDVFPKNQQPLLIAVTILTSLDEAYLQSLHIQQSLPEMVLELATLAKVCGLDGVVCSAEEAPLLRKKLGESFLLVTPGIRTEDAAHHDQKRVVTPKAAFVAGADYIVMGRALTAIADPVSLLRKVSCFSTR